MLFTSLAIVAGLGHAFAQSSSSSVAAISSSSAPAALPAAPMSMQILGVTHTATDTCNLPAAQATARTQSSTSKVKGTAFDRILQVMLETTSYGNATADENCKALIDKGLLLTKMYGVASPSQPNYIAPGSGDIFGLNSDSFVLVDKNISTIVDLLEDKGISWSNYNEGMPYSGFEGYAWEFGLYERKHNLLARFDSVRLVPDRIAKVKNLTSFYVDLENEQIPQWSFVTPNLFDDGHNTDIRTSCAWTRGFVDNLLQNPYFNKNALIYVTWQANGNQPGLANHVAGIILGSALPKELHGARDHNYYNHYSHMSTVEANWNLHTLGRWDVGANVWEFVGEKTGDKIRHWNAHIAGDKFENYLWNQSYGGVFSNANSSHLYVAPNVDLVRNGRTVLPAVKEAWADSSLPDYYKDIIEIPDAFHPPKGYEVPIPNNPPMPITTPIRVYPAAHPPPTPATTPCPPPKRDEL